MPRVNHSKVSAIRPSRKISTYDPFIEAANAIVNDLNLKCGKSFSEKRLSLIELWLSAHFASAQDPTIAREKFEQSEKTYQVGNRQLSGIMSDSYGQTANNLAEGCLVELDKRGYTMNTFGASYD